jgi:hypothetical protein
MRPQRDLLRIGLTLRLDAVAVELTGALAERGIRSLVLRGPALRAALYADGSFRAYDDVDILVAPEQLESSRAILASQGFAPAVVSDTSQPWVRDDGITVDLHTTLVGIGASPSDAWQELTYTSGRLTLGDQQVNVPADATLAVVVALHAAQHGADAGKALSDLGRALIHFPLETWEEAARQAGRLAALPAFAAGLRLLPAGAELATRLELPAELSEEVALRAASAPETAIGLQRLSATSGFANKARLLGSELVPATAFMRSKYPLARKGTLGLAVAYAWRPFWLLGHLGPAVRARRRARRRLR